MENLTTIKFNDLTVVVHVFLTVIMMFFTINLSIGIVINLFSHTFMWLCSAYSYDNRQKWDKSFSEINELKDSFEKEPNSENNFNDGIEHVNNLESDYTHVTYKDMTMRCLKEVHQITVVIDILFLVFFFCARN